MSELKACPFCGSEAKLSTHPGWVKEVHYQELWIVTCTKCAAEHTMRMTCHEDAAARWNRRPIEDALQKRIVELERTVDDLRGDLMQSDRASDAARVAELDAEREKLRAAIGRCWRTVDEVPEAGLDFIYIDDMDGVHTFMHFSHFAGDKKELWSALAPKKWAYIKDLLALEALKGGE